MGILFSTHKDNKYNLIETQLTTLLIDLLYGICLYKLLVQGIYRLIN